MMALAINNTSLRSDTKPALPGYTIFAGGFQVDELGLVRAPADVTPAQLTAAMHQATDLDTMMRLLKGDLLVLAVARFGLEESAQWECDSYFANEHTARNYRYIAGRIPHAMRVHGLLWSHYALVAGGWIDDLERSAMLKVCVQDGYVEKVDWLRDLVGRLWRNKFGDLPYTPANARDPERALAEWRRGGREVYNERISRGPAKPRLAACLKRAREVAWQQATIHGGPGWDRLLAYLDEMDTILKEL